MSDIDGTSALEGKCGIRMICAAVSTPAGGPMIPGRYRTRRGRRGTAAAAVVAGLLVPGWVCATPAGASTQTGHELVVRTDRGLIQGKSAEGTDQWLGVPYAAPPAGALRWAAPRPMARWTGVRQATTYGGRCAQLASGNGPRVDSEDCLYLNVYAPPGRLHGRLPVLFMIH